MEQNQSINYAAELEAIGKKAKIAAEALAVTGDDVKKLTLERMAFRLEAAIPEIINANIRDTESARRKGISSAMLDRLTLDEKRVRQMADGLRIVAAQSDPVGKVISRSTRPNGLEITKISVPFGVIGIIYEARPNVTVDASILCLKAGNAVMLRGGREALRSNLALAALLREALAEAGLPEGAVQFIDITSHDSVSALCKLEEYVDVLIPRGGETLVRAVTSQATMPVLKHYMGVCHAFIDESANLEQAADIVYNGNIDWSEFAAALNDIKYGGVLNFEVKIARNGDESDESIREREVATIAAAKRLLRELGRE